MSPTARSRRATSLPGPPAAGGPGPGRVRAVPLAARRHPLTKVVESRLIDRCGVTPGAPLVLGVSGGADSMALLLACAVLRDRGRGRRGDRSPGFTPIAAHVNHHLRGAESDADEAFVVETCRRLGVAVHVSHVEPASRGGNLAAEARALRYDALARAAGEVGARHVAVAHHGEDQLETMLIALCRGAGAGGLRGMAWSRPLDAGGGDAPGASPITLVRPLLDVRRSDCEAYCRAAQMTWRDDPSNGDVTKVRARLRRDVLPVLDELWPNAAGRAAGAADAIDAAASALAAAVETAFGPAERRTWRRRDLAALPEPVIGAGLRRCALALDPAIADALDQRTIAPAARAVARADRRPRSFAWPGALRLVVTAREVRLEAAANDDAAETGRSRR